MEVTRPILRYHGGKWLMAPWIIAQMPKHRCYVEPFGGAASVLLRKPRSYAEVYNDLDGEVVNLFKVARERGAELRSVLELTPFARAEFLQAWCSDEDSLEQARRTVVRAFMGFGSTAVTIACADNSDVGGRTAKTGFRANSKRSGTTPAHDWANYPDALAGLTDRLGGVVIERRDAKDLIRTHDETETLHYVDPPYVASTRDAGGDYRHEMDDVDHGELAAVLRDVKGMVMLSGYRCALYEGLYGDWQCVERKSFADGARPRVECLWFNDAAWQRRPQQQMFSMNAAALRETAKEEM